MFGRGKKESGKAQMKPADVTDERPPPVFRHFLYLDTEEVLNALSAVQGGAVEEAVDEIVRSGEGNLGVSIGVGGQGITLGGKKASQVKRSIKRRQTLHAAIAALLYTLRSQIRQLPDARPNGDQRGAPLQIEENDLIQFDCDLCHCRSHAVVTAFENERKTREKRNWVERLFAHDKGDEKQDLERAEGLGEMFVALAWPDAAGDGPKFAVCLQSEHLVVAPAEFSRRATVVGQVVGKPLEGESVVLIGDPQGTTAVIAQSEEAPPTGKVRTSGRAHLRVAELEWSAKVDLNSWSNACLLRPLCIFK